RRSSDLAQTSGLVPCMRRRWVEAVDAFRATFARPTGARMIPTFRSKEGPMLWAIPRPQRPRSLNAKQPQHKKLTKAEAEMLCYGIGYFGGLETFSFQCPGPCSTLHHVRPRQRRRLFDRATQRFRCPECGIE